MSDASLDGCCTHERSRTDCVLARFAEYASRGPHFRVAEIAIRCLDCGAVARWQGVPGGLAPHEPRRSPFGDELRAPLVFAHDGEP